MSFPDYFDCRQVFMGNQFIIMKSKPFYFLRACSFAVVSVLITVFSACDPDEEKRSCKMTKIESQLPWGDEVVTEFDYSNERVTGVQFDFGASGAETYSITYTGDNITSVTAQSSPGAPWATLRYTNDVLAEVVYSDGISVTLSFNASNQFIKAQYWSTYQGVKEAIYNYTLTYPNATTANPSVVKFFPGQTTSDPYLEDELTYDDKINPTAEWPLALLFGISDSGDDSNATFNPTNNITNSSVSGANTYTYNKLNYPTRVVTADGQTDDIIYECN
jgi:hypothetical protein